MLYIELYKSLYGLMRSALLFYKKLGKELEEYGMKINLFDMCLANMDTATGNQLTVIWHMDNLKILCKNKFEVTKLICYISRIYGDKMTMHWGGKGKYLGMHLDFTGRGTFQVNKSHYVQEILNDFPEPINKSCMSPYGDKLFAVAEMPTDDLLSEEQAMQFHRINVGQHEHKAKTGDSIPYRPQLHDEV